jgi:hypothetical protein
MRRVLLQMNMSPDGSINWDEILGTDDAEGTERFA